MIILLVLIIVILIHTLVEKGFKHCNGFETAENSQNLEETLLIDTNIILCELFVVLWFFSLYIYSPIQILPFRYTLLFQDFNVLLVDGFRMIVIYSKNPHIRSYLNAKLHLRKTLVVPVINTITRKMDSMHNSD